MPFHSLVYTSTAAVPVTGHLLYTSGSFLQELEGDEQAVEELYARIERDERHRDVVLLGREEREQRDFADWVMSMVRFSPGQLAAFGVQGSDLRSLDTRDELWRKRLRDELQSLATAKLLLRSGPPETGSSQPVRPADAGWMFLRA